MAQTATDKHGPDANGAAKSKPRANSNPARTDPAREARAPQQADLTVEQLAAEVGMSVRNIRNHHTRGLLPAPEVRARIGYYGPEHVARLRLTLEMQADGFNLAAIERLMNAPGG